MPEKLLRRVIVSATTSLPRSSLYDLIKRGEFPAPVKLGTRSVAWRESEVMAWIESRQSREA